MSRTSHSPKYFRSLLARFWDPVRRAHGAPPSGCAPRQRGRGARGCRHCHHHYDPQQSPQHLGRAHHLGVLWHQPRCGTERLRDLLPGCRPTFSLGVLFTGPVLSGGSRSLQDTGTTTTRRGLRSWSRAASTVRAHTSLHRQRYLVLGFPLWLSFPARTPCDWVSGGWVGSAVSFAGAAAFNKLGPDSLFCNLGNTSFGHSQLSSTRHDAANGHLSSHPSPASQLSACSAAPAWATWL